MTTITQEINTNATPAKAYEALTTHAGLAGWWAKDTTFGEGVGGEHSLRFVKGDRRVTMAFRVDELVESKRVKWTCTANGNPIWVGTTLTWEVEAAGEGSQVRFAHAGFSEDQSPPYQMTVEGWRHFENSLRAYLQSGEGQPW